MKIKNILLLLLVFLVVNMSIFYITKVTTEDKVEIVLNDDLHTLKTHYKILLETQRSTAEAIYQTTLNIAGFSEILAAANSATQEKKVELRKSLNKLLSPMYKVIKQRGVLQYHFILRDNESFYRAHKPDKFGDNLTDVRADLKYTNATQKPIRGFTQGRTAHGFRNTFPVFDKNNTHVGAMEVSFSSESFQWYLNNISGIHTHFIVDKDIFDSKAWQRDDLILKYEKSAEAPNYMITLNSIHTRKECIEENGLKLTPMKEEIETKMALGKEFSIYVEHHGTHIDVVSFLPIKSIQEKTVAWIVSYEVSPIIEMALHNQIRMRIITFFLSLLIIYFIVQQIFAKREIEKQHKLLNNILNATDNAMIITDFKDIKYSNNKFKNLLNVKYTENFNSSTNHNMLNVFAQREGYLHSGLLKEHEDFVSLITRTPPEDRVVAIFDNNLEITAFKISISKSENSSDYLMTLTDITKMKEHHDETQKKVYRDPLTNVYNRSKFDKLLSQEIESTKRYNTHFSIAILDIDKFKDFNDTYGHLIGDEVLITMAQMIEKNVRESDVFARWGGEEFVVLFKNTSKETAKLVSEQLKSKIEANEHPTAGKITASFGVTEYQEGDNSERLFKRCDDALYIAKANGRNRVEAL